jgi:hypothetical protein
MKEASINREQFFMPNQQSAVVSDPRKRLLDNPTSSISPKFSTVWAFRFFPVFSMGTYQIHLTSLKFISKDIAAIGTICKQSFGARSRSSRAISWHFDFDHYGINKYYFVRGCRGNNASQRNSLAVDHHRPLRSIAPFGFPNPKAPFFDGAKLSSMKASSRSKSDFSSKSAKDFRHTSSQTPLSSHNRNSHQQADELEYSLGRSFHRAPVLNIHRMPSSTCRLSAGGRPTWPFWGFGDNGSIFFHWASFRNRVCSAIGSPPIAYDTKTLQKYSSTSC